MKQEDSKVNKVCQDCAKECKQRPDVEVIRCPIKVKVDGGRNPNKVKIDEGKKSKLAQNRGLGRLP